MYAFNLFFNQSSAPFLLFFALSQIILHAYISIYQLYLQKIHQFNFYEVLILITIYFIRSILFFVKTILSKCKKYTLRILKHLCNA